MNELIRMNPHLRQQLKIFKLTIKNINMTMMYQAKYLSEELIDGFFELKSVKAST